MTRQDLHSLEGWEFENLIFNLVKKMGFQTEDRKRGPDGGIDIMAHNDEPLLKGKYVIQCKRYSKPVGVELIRDLYGVVHSANANKGILITNSTFTDAAEEFSKGKQLELIDGSKLLHLLNKYGVEGFSEENIDIPLGILTSYDYLIKPMKEVLKKVRDYRDGVVYINKTTFTESRYDQMIINHYWKLWEYNDALIAQYDNSVQLLNSNTEEEQENIKHYSKLMVDAVKSVVENYIEIMSVNPPSKFINTQKILLDVFENIFSPWETYIYKFENLIHNPPEDDTSVDLIADFRGIHNSLMAFKAEYETTTRETSSQQYDTLDAAVDIVDTASSLLSGCFIVTAVYGSPLASEINPFRNFRDKILITNPIGNILVRMYYVISPHLATIISRSTLMRKTLRYMFVEPILKCLRSRGYE